MTVDFRCEKCGKLLSIDAEPGSSVRCPHCEKKLTVPAALASLPRPQVPPSASSGAAAPPASSAIPAGPQGLDVELFEEEPGSGMAVMGILMPWIMSLLFHAGLGMIMLLVVLVAAKKGGPDIGTAEVDTVEVPELELAARREKLSENQQKSERNYSRRKTNIKADTGKTKKQVRLIARGGNEGSSEMFGDMPSGGGNFFGDDGPGGAGTMHHVVFVIDRSGSMVGEFGDVKTQMVEYIAKMRPPQDFHVVLFAEGKALENKPKRLVLASDINKEEVVDFLFSPDVIPGGKTTVLPALQRAFAVLKKADMSNGKRGKLIYLLTDGDFSGGGGGSPYKGLVGNEAVLKWLQDNNSSKEVHVSALLYGNEKTAVKVMKTIARENGGKFTLIDVN